MISAKVFPAGVLRYVGARFAASVLCCAVAAAPCLGAPGELTTESEAALERGLKWLAENQGPEGNWQSDDLGLVSMGALAFLSAGHLPDRGPYGDTVRRSLDYMIRHAQPSGLLNIAEPRRAMYNHGLATFVLGQAYGMSDDRRLGPILDRALTLIAQTQCDDGGWDYHAKPLPRGHDLSLVVMQAKALRSAVDSGLEVSPEVVEQAIHCVREHYRPKGCPADAPEIEQQKHPGQFTYSKGGGHATVALAAAGVVCLQEFGQYDDWRIAKNTDVIYKEVQKQADPEKCGKSRRAPLNNAYALYYVGQALYQVGGEPWDDCYPRLRDSLVASQIREPENPSRHGMWQAGKYVSGRPGELYMTAVGCFVLAIPNRYLPILQEGRIGSLQQQFGRD
jgi:hypothetical protein